MPESYRESWVERQIREATERGEFDNLPGTGKPLGDLGNPDDPDWWVRRYVEREKLDVSGALPAPLMLRKEKAGFPQSLADVRTEREVREILEDFNHRVKVDRLRPAVGAMPPLLVGTVPVDQMVEQWRALREAAAHADPVVLPPVGNPVGPEHERDGIGGVRRRLRAWFGGSPP